MIPLLKSEFRKLLTVRSTYIASAIGLAILIFFCFWIEGYKGGSGSPASELQSGALAELVINSSLTSVIISIVAILFVGHEYRHNTIMYTLTAANSRLKVLIAKTGVVVVYSAFYTLLGVLVAIGSYYVGLSFRDAVLPAQNFDIWYQLGRIVYYGVGYGIIGLLLGVLLRNIVGAIAFMLLVPTTIESLLGILLKDNAVYLPFTALERFVGSHMYSEGAALSIPKALVITLAYFIGTWIVTAYLFQRRDAN